MEVVAGLSLKNLKPRVWDAKDEYHLPALRAVMVSYADFHSHPRMRERAMAQGLRKFLNAPKKVRIYMDNGAFYFLNRDGELPRAGYEEFVRAAKPDWYPVPQEHIPTPMMTAQKRASCMKKTMAVNREYNYDGFAPIAHVSSVLPRYISQLREEEFNDREDYALGGIVPNLLRAPRAMPYDDILRHLFDFRAEFAEEKIHLFGVGGTATAHIAALVGFDSIDSSGWRNRAARGIIQLPGKGDRIVANLGKWRGREINKADKAALKNCGCPACRKKGWQSLRKKGSEGFCNRAAHNLWVLLEEAKWAVARVGKDEYSQQYRDRLDNTVYLPIVSKALALSADRQT